MFKDTSYSFFTLPAELRIKIYKMCMVDHDDNVLDLSCPLGPDPTDRSAALLRTCSAMYKETMPVLYGHLKVTIQLESLFKEYLTLVSATARANFKQLLIIWDNCSWDDDGVDRPYCKLQHGVLFLDAESRESLGLLQGLKRVTLHASKNWTRSEDIASWWLALKLDRPPHETFIESMSGAEIKQDEGLHALMQQFPHHENIEWQLHLSSGEYLFATHNGPLPRLETVHVKAKISVRKVGQSAERWVVEKIGESVSVFDPDL